MKKLILLALALSLVSQVWAQNYNQLHDMLIKFYCYQRAGLASGSAGNCNPGYANAWHGGDNYNGNKLDGGWYDAGDYIKFGMPLGYTVYCLLKGYDVFPSAYSVSNGIPNILTEVKFATDYLTKAVINDNTIVLDVGQAADEHETWGVKYESGRSGNQILLCSGADIPATYAACLALMSTLYRKFDKSYADLCLAKAKVAFEFARKKIEAGGDNNLYCSAQQKHGKYLYYYPDVEGKLQRQINDKMVAAGVELYRATNDENPIYKTWAKKSITSPYSIMGYAYIGPLAAFEVWRQGLGGSSALTSNVSFIETKIQTTGVFKDIFKNSGWGTAREAGSAAFEYALAYIVSNSDDTRALYSKRIKNHVDWVAGYFGDPKRSYVIGFNNSPANYIHYRTTRSGPQGGLVSGPDDNGNWSNDGTPEHCEVAIDYNAGITGAVAFLKAINDPGTDVKVNQAFSATNKEGVNFSSQKVKFTAGFSKSVAWTVKISGAYGSKTFTGTGTSISQEWDGSADNGFFLSGETVAANLSIEGNIVAYDIVKAKGINIIIEAAKKPATSTGDVLVDNFDDKDSTHQINGNKWVAFGTGTSVMSIVTDEGSGALRVTCNVASQSNSIYAGVKATLNGGSPISIGPAKAIAFDMKSNKEATVYVELEQANITDGAYYSTVVPVMKVRNTYRLNIADFTQPSWKTASVPLDLNNITALRFTVYDSIGFAQLTLDNVFVDQMQVVVSSRYKMPEMILQSYLKPLISNGSLTYKLPEYSGSRLDVAIFDMKGKLVLKQGLNGKNNGMASVSLSRLPSGMYTAVHYIDGKASGSKINFINAR